MIYRRRPSPLHATRAAAALLWCAALAFAVLVQSNPIVLGALTLAILLAGTGARVGRSMLRVLGWALVAALTICVINALVTRDGLTVIWRFGDLPVLGQTNVTLEATVYGAVLGLRAAALMLLGALYSLAVDPDELLRLMRRFSFRSALTATIATRMVPILVRDGRRIADAQRCRAGAEPGRLQLLRATTSGVLDRALDVAATLEVRGYATAAAQPRRDGAPAATPLGRPARSRHDLAFYGSAAAILVLAVGSRIASAVPFSAYPTLHAPATPGVLLTGAALLACALAPFLDQRGIQP